MYALFIAQPDIFLFIAHPQCTLLRDGPEGLGKVGGAMLSQLIQLPAQENGTLPKLAAFPEALEESSKRCISLFCSVAGLGDPVCVCVCVCMCVCEREYIHVSQAL